MQESVLLVIRTKNEIKVIDFPETTKIIDIMNLDCIPYKRIKQNGFDR